jgi:TetR/AcrR family transcriptional regulator, regulator of cefoperazone and chloramphenicol sensitivity
MYGKARPTAPLPPITAEQRIRDAALEGFATQGLEATSIRDVAEAAGVSPGLVQHYFPTKAALSEAVNEHVVGATRDAFADLLTRSSASVDLEQIGERVTAFVAEHPLVFRYVGRALVEGNPTALEVFDSLVGIADVHLRRLADAGRIRADVDLEWAAVHGVLVNVATILLETAVSRQFDRPLFTPEGLERWRQATTAMLQSGWYVGEPEPGSRR